MNGFQKLWWQVTISSASRRWWGTTELKYQFTYITTAESLLSSDIAPLRSSKLSSPSRILYETPDVIRKANLKHWKRSRRLKWL
jgi:hypothetical protein